MNAEVRDLAADAERAARAGDDATAVQGFVDAGDCAARYQLWKTAVRWYRHALEVDLLDRTALARLIGLAGRSGSPIEWGEYAREIDRATWPSFGCRGAHILINDTGAVVECPGIGPVLEILMPTLELVEAHPDGRFTGMPLAMALIILRRALWPSPRDTPQMIVRIAFAGRAHVTLDELGDWEQLTK